MSFNCIINLLNFFSFFYASHQSHIQCIILSTSGAVNAFYDELSVYSHSTQVTRDIFFKLGERLWNIPLPTLQSLELMIIFILGIVNDPIPPPRPHRESMLLVMQIFIYPRVHCTSPGTWLPEWLFIMIWFRKKKYFVGVGAFILRTLDLDKHFFLVYIFHYFKEISSLNSICPTSSYQQLIILTLVTFDGIKMGRFRTVFNFMQS